MPNALVPIVTVIGLYFGFLISGAIIVETVFAWPGTLAPGCQIDIRLLSHQGYAELVIEDNGPGFPPEIRNRALERFVKGKHSPGNGLGLAFVGAVAQAHGGMVKISESPGWGRHGFAVIASWYEDVARLLRETPPLSVDRCR